MLALHAAQIIQIVTAIAQILLRLLAIQMLIALWQMNRDTALGVIIIHILLHIDIHATNGINQFTEDLHIEHDVLVNGNAQQCIDLPGHQWSTAHGIKIFYLHLLLAARDIYPGILRDMDKTQLAGTVFEAGHHNAVGLLFGAAIDIHTIIQPHNQHIGIAVKTRVNLPPLGLLTLAVAIIHGLIFLIDTGAQGNQRITGKEDSREHHTKKNQHNQQPQPCPPPSLGQQFSFIFNILLGDVFLVHPPDLLSVKQYFISGNYRIGMNQPAFLQDKGDGLG